MNRFIKFYQKGLALTFLLFVFFVTASIQSAVSVGGLVVIGVGVDAEEVLVVALEDVAAGEEVFFTDEEWSGSAFESGEGFVSWTTPSISAGTVITLTNNSSTGGGTVSSKAGSFALANSGDGVFLYQTDTNTYNAGTVTNLFFAGKSESFSGTLTGTGLTSGTNAVFFGGDNGIYTGARSGLNNFSDYLPLIADASNWSTSGSAQTFDTSAFSVVPEPRVFGIVLALSGMGFVIIRNSRR